MLGIPLHTLGVAVFFALSGYLVMSSRDRMSSAPRFLWHRCLRIFPGLVIVVIVTVLVVGPLSSTLQPAAYFGDPQTREYLRALGLMPAYDLPGVFESTVHARSAVNGSLWTLGIEFLCYLAVLAIGLIPARTRWIALAVIASAAVVVSGVGSYAEATGWAVVAPAAEMVVFFAAGALASCLRVRLRASVALAVFAAWVAATLVAPQLALPLAWLALPYCVLALAFGSIPVVRSVGRVGDLSYGTYLWAYLVQQVVIDLAPALPLAASVGLVIVVTLPIAALSWWFVEKPALSAKGWRSISSTHENRRPDRVPLRP